MMFSDGGRRGHSVVLSGILALATATAAVAQPAQPPDSVRAGAARQLLVLMGAADAALSVMEAQLPAQQAAMPQVPAEFWTEFMSLAKRDLGQLVEAMVPMYATRFSLEELGALTAFYGSPVGQRMATLQPELAKEAAAVGQQWGARLGAEAARVLEAKPKPPSQ